jgi:esterase/lipase superfamily enzyme
MAVKLNVSAGVNDVFFAMRFQDKDLAIKMFRVLRLIIAGLFLTGALSACGAGGTLELNVAQVEPSDSSGRVKIFIATTRQASTETAFFSGERGSRNAFAAVDISIPRKHVAGALELPSSGKPVPADHFTVTSARRLELPNIVAEVRAAIASRPAHDRDVLVFIHGYNTTFADAALRFAQIVHDSGYKGVPVLFTWPSRAEVLAYAYDRESALYSRDFLEGTLRAISRDLGAARVDVLAHSMGTMLTLETLRQAKIRGDGNFGGKLRDVMLASPDVDLDVFRTQLHTIDRPITVFVSKDDKALAFSRRFAGDKRRLGALSSEDADTLADLKSKKVEIIDLSDVSSSDSFNHGKFASSPKVVAMIGKRLQSDNSRPAGLGGAIGDVAGGVLGVVGSGVELVINAPAAIITGGRAAPISLPRP